MSISLNLYSTRLSSIVSQPKKVISVVVVDVVFVIVVVVNVFVVALFSVTNHITSS